MAIPFFTSHWARLARANKHDGPGDEPGGDADQASSEHDAAPDAEEPENVDAAEEPGLPEGPPESRVQKATGMLKGIVDKAASPIEERAFAPTEEKGAPKPGPFGRFVLSLERLVLSPLYESEDSIGVNQMARLIVV